MAKMLERKKPGFTRSGEVRIVSLSYKQCAELLDKTQKKKVQGKIRRRMQALEQRPGFVKPTVVETVAHE